jgi:hypothetical protein
MKAHPIIASITIVCCACSAPFTAGGAILAVDGGGEGGEEDSALDGLPDSVGGREAGVEGSAESAVPDGSGQGDAASPDHDSDAPEVLVDDVNAPDVDADAGPCQVYVNNVCAGPLPPACEPDAQGPTCACATSFGSCPDGKTPFECSMETAQGTSQVWIACY